MKQLLASLVVQMCETGITYDEAVREFKKRFILTVLERHRGNQSRAAKELGMHRNTLGRLMAEMDLCPATVRTQARRPPRSERVAPAGRNVAR